ncbi:MAG: YfiR family protein [candidate division NC10 bacterium]|nr:YfiR family protein [candidate division NC10 bacterium]MDE2321652.1 YfiR family protein [candidate division NC10 bacterium]
MIRKVALFVALSVAGFVGGGMPLAEPASPPPLEYQVKAAFLYQFIKFVEWPPQALRNSTIIIGVLGESPVSDALTAIEGQEVKGRTVVVKRFKGLADLEFAHVLFLSPEAAGRLKEIWNRLAGSGTLVVSDVEGFARSGGTINFIRVENKIRFEINLEAAERAHLKISSQLLKLARIVQGVE